MKSMTGSRMVVTLFNRYGYSINYHCAEELETELAFAHDGKQTIITESVQPNRIMGNAYDSYDKLAYALSGANSLHDTTGVIYQNKDETHRGRRDASERIVPTTWEKPQKRRKLDTDEHALLPYRKTPIVKSFCYSKTNVWDRSVATQLKARKADYVFMMSHAFKIDGTPMWGALNARYHMDIIPRQKICYIPNISHSPASLNVVAETLQLT
ncbi:Hypothetical predicted protein [Octopus vulgaris]|uniref:Uncharacterized protein n=1 Tax=Octopus vulgaris TaxID=6645 RepID=A0AA36B0P8_OCTVU|nr:Hypothetical predicted protein [Octopus vulgaris]